MATDVYRPGRAVLDAPHRRQSRQKSSSVMPTVSKHRPHRRSVPWFVSPTLPLPCNPCSPPSPIRPPARAASSGARDALGRTSDRVAATMASALPPGTLRLADLGYFSLTLLPSLIARRVFVLRRFPAQPLGATARVACRTAAHLSAVGALAGRAAHARAPPDAREAGRQTAQTSGDRRSTACAPSPCLN